MHTIAARELPVSKCCSLYRNLRTSTKYGFELNIARPVETERYFDLSVLGPDKEGRDFKDDFREFFGILIKCEDDIYI